jgi:hypothetical protein
MEIAKISAIADILKPVQKHQIDTITGMKPEGNELLWRFIFCYSGGFSSWN